MDRQCDYLSNHVVCLFGHLPWLCGKVCGSSPLEDSGLQSIRLMKMYSVVWSDRKVLMLANKAELIDHECFQLYAVGLPVRSSHMWSWRHIRFKTTSLDKDHFYPSWWSPIFEKSLNNVSVFFLCQFFTLGVTGMIGVDDILVCFVAANSFNWDGYYVTEIRGLSGHTSFQDLVDSLLNSA